MAGPNECPGIAADRLRDRADGAGPANARSEFGIRDRASHGNLGELTPYRLLKRRAPGREGEIKHGSPAFEIVGDLERHPAQQQAISTLFAGCDIRQVSRTCEMQPGQGLGIADGHH